MSSQFLQNPFRQAFGLWGTFGAVVGAISILNLIVRFFDLGLSIIIADLIAAYFWLFHEVIFGFIWQIIHIDVPPWLTDIFILWSVMASITIRTIFMARNFATQYAINLGDGEKWLFFQSKIKFTASAISLSLLFWPLLFIRFLYSKRIDYTSPIFNVNKYDISIMYSAEDLEKDKFKSYLTYRNILFQQIIAILGLVILLIVTNAGLPSSSTP